MADQDHREHGGPERATDLLHDPALAAEHLPALTFGQLNNKTMMGTVQFSDAEASCWAAYSSSAVSGYERCLSRDVAGRRRIRQRIRVCLRRPTAQRLGEGKNLAGEKDGELDMVCIKRRSVALRN